ncbi:MAG: GGDEF domain-containing protein [Xanthobacteraceae bacterium]|nr:GGDEF domain-containing protein [Xanthobacteraceae bacterium]QYK44590.1 MAG: GGDEF domain-containing protein [Xanthobacteraceae bacterium]
MPREKPQNKRAGNAQRGNVAPRKSVPERVSPDSTPGLAAEIERLRHELRKSAVRIQQLEKSAHEDALTGLLNRRGFEAAFARTASYLARYGGDAALLYLDLDGFKPVNDRLGHAAGDVVLQEIARLLRGSVRGSDMAARLGGDEFALLLLHIDAAQAEKKARALEELIKSASFEFANERPGIGASIGAATIGGGEALDDVMQRADAAMYARKRERKG